MKGLDFSLMYVTLTPLLREYIKDRVLNLSDVEIMTAIQTIGGHRGFFGSKHEMAEALFMDYTTLIRSLKKLIKNGFVTECIGEQNKKTLYVECEEIRGRGKMGRSKKYGRR